MFDDNISLGRYFAELIDNKHIVKSHLAKDLGINPRTFLSKLDKDTLNAYDLIKLFKYFDLDINDLKRFV